MDNQKQKILFFVVIFLSVFLFFFLIWYNSPARQAQLSKRPQKAQQTTRPPKKQPTAKKNITDSSQFGASDQQFDQTLLAAIPQQNLPISVPSSAHFQPGMITIEKGGRGSFSEQELKEMQARRERLYEKSNIIGREKLLSIVNDESLSEMVRLRYKLRLIEPYVQGIEFFDEGNYSEAIKMLFKSLNDPMATPVTRYFALDYMRTAATELKDFGLYLELTKLQSKIVAEDDLSLLDIEKTNSGLDWCAEQEELYKASQSTSEFDKVIAQRMRGSFPTPSNYAARRSFLTEQIDEFKESFKRFF